MIYTEIEYLWSDRCLFFGYGIVGGVLIILYERWGLDKTFFPKKNKPEFPSPPQEKWTFLLILSVGSCIDMTSPRKFKTIKTIFFLSFFNSIKYLYDLF